MSPCGYYIITHMDLVSCLHIITHMDLAPCSHIITHMEPYNTGVVIITVS